MPAPSSRSISSGALRREHRRLQRAFAAIVVALAPAATVQACGSSTPETGPGDDAGADVTHADAHDGAALVDAADADASQSCVPVIVVFDAAPDAEPGCEYTLPCGLSPVTVAIGCDLYTGPDDLPLDARSLGCRLEEGEGCTADAYAPTPDGVVKLLCVDCTGSGRRTRGLARPRPLGAPSAAGAYFARMAHDEAASVHAFRRMAEELSLHGAPAALVRAAERSARDEERHARAMSRHARKLAAPIPRPRVRRSGPRALEAIARENAVEGCVHETFGALVLRWQAANAPDAALRRTFARIAADETRHAAVAWAVARWAEDRLDAAGRARVDAARSRATSQLLRMSGRCAAPFDAQVGRPGPADRAALLDGMLDRLLLA